LPLSETKDVDAEVLLVGSCLSEGGRLTEDLGDVVGCVENVEFIACDEYGEGLTFGFLAGREINKRIVCKERK
jgi:hypothetical protein